MIVTFPLDFFVSVKTFIAFPWCCWLNVLCPFRCYKLWQATGGTNVLDFTIGDVAPKGVSSYAAFNCVVCSCCTFGHFHAVNHLLFHCILLADLLVCG